MKIRKSEKFIGKLFQINFRDKLLATVEKKMFFVFIKYDAERTEIVLQIIVAA